MKKKDKIGKDHDPIIFAICFIAGIIGSNFVEYEILSIIVGFIVGAILAKKPKRKYVSIIA